MLFNSIAYILFLALVAAAYYIFPLRVRWIWLIMASIAYYISFIPVFVFLLTGLVAINYFLALWLANASDRNRNRVFIQIVIFNILILALFKYFTILFPNSEFHIFSLNLLSQPAIINKMILPLGLSYFTFTLLSYLIEIKRRNITAERHFGYFSLFMLFFPKIAQGPIERPQNLIPQLRQNNRFNSKMVADGLLLMLQGYFKKLVIADRLAIYVNAVYNNNEHHNGTTLIVATVFFAFQIYADFSGYTDIAIGSAKLFGFNLTENFKRPYFATSVKDFWNRWHISFSSWLRDYIFMPIAYYLTNKLKKEKYFSVSADKWIYLIAIMVTFIICGIWHGVGWTYLIWGILFGVYQTISNWTVDFQKKTRKKLGVSKKSAFYRFYEIAITFILVLSTWVFFRAGSLPEAVNIFTRIFTSYGSVFSQSPSNLIYALIGIMLFVAIDFRREFLSDRWAVTSGRYVTVRIAGILFFVLVILLLGVFDGGQFIYFQF